MKKIVAFGGGTGLSTLLRGIRHLPMKITAVVAMTDNGACSGALRKDMGILPPGDVRKCIAALSSDESLLVDMFQYRFKNGPGLDGRSLGNLMLTALIDMTGSIEMAIESISKILSVNGTVLPVSLENVDLKAVFDDGAEIIGEVELQRYGYEHKITKVSLTKEVKANPKVLKAIKEADYILIGPGGLYSSIMPNFLIPEVVETLKASKAKKIYVCNVSTERGETRGFSAEDHRETLKQYGVIPDLMLVNNHPFPEGSGDGYLFPVNYDKKDKSIVDADLVNEENFLYHDSNKLCQAISELLTRIETPVN